MKLLLPEVNYGEGFSTQNDIFERKKLANQLSSIIKKSDDDSLVIALDDQWDNGKTTFLKMWENEIITNDEFNVIYFDAFQNDYQDDAFLALSSAIYPHIEKPADKRKYLKAAGGVGKFIVKAGAKVGLRAATLGIVKDTDFDGLNDSIKESIEEPIEKLIEEKLKNATKETISIKKFKESITASAKENKIVFIIDELDRARPDFSLDLLEKIKHVFNTKKLFFVLAMNKEQFKHTIKKRYGEIDSETYLSKFIHFWFSLPHPKNEQGYTLTVERFLKHLSNKMELDEHYSESVELLTKALEYNNASLRDCERCFSLLTLVLASQPQLDTVFQYAAAMLVYLKTRHPLVFENIRLGSSSHEELNASLNVDKWRDVNRDYIYKLLLTHFASYENIRKSDNAYDRFLMDRIGRPIKALDSILPFFEHILDN